MSEWLSRVQLCNPMYCSRPCSSIHGILQARILEGVATPGDLPNPGIEPRSPALQADSLPSKPQGRPLGGGGGETKVLGSRLPSQTAGPDPKAGLHPKSLT